MPPTITTAMAILIISPYERAGVEGRSASAGRACRTRGGTGRDSSTMKDGSSMTGSVISSSVR